MEHMMKARKSIPASLLLIMSTITFATLRQLPAGRLSSLLVLGLFSGCVSTHAQRYVEISAEIELFAWRGEETNGAANAKPRIISVVCIMGTNEWRIEHDFLRGGEEKYFFDGTNVYESIHITTPVPTELKDKISTVSGLATAAYDVAKSNLTINIWPSHDGHPLGDKAANIPWLAFCSGPYLKRNVRLIPLPVDNLHHTPDRFAYSDKTETFEDEFGLPRTVDLFTSKSLYQTSANDFYKEWFSDGRFAESTKSVVPNLEEGVLMFHYAVTESTNLLGWSFPLKFEFFQKGREYVQNGNWFHRGTGRVKSIRPSAKPGNLFVPTMQQTIVDWRFRDATKSVHAITYTSTNAFAAPTNDPVLKERFIKRVERAPP